MAVCDECYCYNDDHVDNEGLTDEQLVDNPQYEPHLYYYWHGDIQEDYQMSKGKECLCEGCYELLLSDNKIIEKILDNGKINPIWNDDTMGWYMPIEEVAQ